MKKTVLTLAASAVMAFCAVQLAAASEHHRATPRHPVRTEFRNSNAYALPDYRAAEPEGYRYSGGWSAPAGR